MQSRRTKQMRVLVTGASGFIGKNLMIHLKECSDIEIATFLKGEPLEALAKKVGSSDFIFHLAGANRPKNKVEFQTANVDLTNFICEAIEASGREIPVLYTSSTQAERDNPYGKSKRMAEEFLRTFSASQGNPIYIYRLPNVFGKWCRPNYNSAVATFCHNIMHNIPIQINDPKSVIQLVYIDDVVSDFLRLMKDHLSYDCDREIHPVYRITVGDLAECLNLFKRNRTSLLTEPVGTGLTRALYSTFVSYFPPKQFSYPLKKHEDPRGVFVEMLKTHDSGQFSYFTAHPGVTRGGHYHHTKTEKFLVIKGRARFGFRHIETEETYEHFTSGHSPEVVETIPGWAHDITNIGDDEMIVLLWANEIFDREYPDTKTHKV